jgi:glutamate-ammonia-ligase adenylyltransferase
MLDLFSASQRIAQTVTRYPALLDELIDPSLGARPPDQEGIQAGVDRILNSPADAETTLGDLNYLKQVIQLRIAVAMLQTTMSAHAVGLVLSQLAQGLVQAVLSLALLEMRSRHGDLPGPQLTVVAYGSLGACNLGFDSDLDLIFLYQPMSLLSDGKRPITAERYHTGVARRMLGFLSVLTPSGRLYNIDARLRPNGRAGLLVSSVKAFKRYQMEEAWCWELQALTRARAIAGDPETGDSFRSIRKAVLSKPRDIKQVKQAVLDMRARIQSQHGETSPLKYGHGGLLDIEFIVQLGLLLNTEAHPQIIGSTEIDKQLQALLDCGWLDSGALALLQDAYSQLSEARQRAALLDEAEKTQISSLLNIAQALCNEILR